MSGSLRAELISVCAHHFILEPSTVSDSNKYLLRAYYIILGTEVTTVHKIVWERPIYIHRERAGAEEDAGS